MQFPPPLSLQLIPRKTLTIREPPLGRGSFGVVSRATWHGTDVAIKEFFLKELSDTLREEFDHEVSLMAQCRHPNIVGLYGILDEAGHRGLVIEYMPQGSLRNLLDNRKRQISWDTRWAMAIDIGNGLRYLHDQDIVHRDINSLNVLLGADLQAKIGDFRLARIRLEASSTGTRTKGTVRWCAPESFSSEFEPASSMDVYSYGMVLWEITSGEIPFAGSRNEQTLISWIKDGEQETIPADCPPGFGEVISQAWLGAQQRPRIEKLVNDLVRTKPQPAPPLPEKKEVEKSWHFDPATERRAGAREDGKPYQILKATGKDKQKVVSFYQHHPVPGYHVARVQVIYNRGFNVVFEEQLKRLQQRNGEPVFAPAWHTKNEPEWRAATHSKLEELARPHADPDYPGVKLVPLWHGTRRDITDSIFRTGYVSLGSTDSGFFGRGLYGAHEAEYAWRVYGPGNRDKFKTPAEGALILNWVASFSAYPVIHGDIRDLEGKGHYKNYDAHFIPVVPQDPLSPSEKKYYPCRPDRNNVYTELVTFESASCLPRYLVELEPDLVRSPVVLPAAIPQVILTVPPPQPQWQLTQEKTKTDHNHVTTREEVLKWTGSAYNDSLDVSANVLAVIERGDFPTGYPVTLRGLCFKVTEKQNSRIIIPANVILDNCKVSAGNISFSAGTLTAIAKEATAIANGNGAEANAAADGANAYAVESGAVANATASGADAYALESGGVANATASGAKAFARKSGGVANATASGARASAWKSGAVANATASGAEASAVESGTVANATASGAEATASGSDAVANASASGARASALGSGAVANATASGARASAVGSGAVANASASGARASAWGSGAVANASASGAKAGAMGSGGVANATASGANAYAWKSDAVANATASGAVANATVDGAKAAAGVPGALAIRYAPAPVIKNDFDY